MNTSIEYRKTLIIMQIWWIFLLLEVGGFDFRLVAAKVIGQHMFFFILSYFLDNNLWNKKKYDSFSAWKHDKWPNDTPVQHFCSGFDHANLVSSFRGSKFFPKIGFSNVYIFEYEHSKRFVRKDDNIFVYKRRIGYRTCYPNWRWYM